MQPIYNDYVTEEMARKLLNLNFPLHKYSVGNYNGKPSFFTVSEADPMWADSDRFKIPTYAEVMDMLYDKGYIISIEPVELLDGRYRYHFKVYQDNTEGKGDLVVLVSGLAGSSNNTFKETLFDAITCVIYNLEASAKLEKN